MFPLDNEDIKGVLCFHTLSKSAPRFPTFLMHKLTSSKLKTTITSIDATVAKMKMWWDQNLTRHYKTHFSSSKMFYLLFLYCERLDSGFFPQKVN